MNLFLSLALSFAVYWHVAAFAAGGICVWLSYRALFGLEAYTSYWGKIIRHADMHLWLSGLAIIVIGGALRTYPEYLSNPKLWAKVTVVTLWLCSTHYLRRVALPKFRDGKRKPMMYAAALNLSGWLYGAWLGVAHGLSHIAGSYPFFLAGFAFLAALLFGLTVSLEKHRTA